MASEEHIQAAKEFMECAGAMLGRGEMPAPASPYTVKWHAAHATILAELSRLEGENARYRGSALKPTIDALLECNEHLAEARRQIEILSMEEKSGVRAARSAIKTLQSQVAERDEALKEVLPWAEMGFFLWDARSFTAGDRQTEPEERTIEWQWQQARPDDYGMTAMRADVEKFLADLTEDTEATPWVLELPVVAARALLASPPTGVAEKEDDPPFCAVCSDPDDDGPCPNHRPALASQHGGGDA